MYPRSARGRITGRRASLAIIDDAFASDDALMETEVERRLNKLHEIHKLFQGMDSGYSWRKKGIQPPKFTNTKIVDLHTPHATEPNDCYTPSLQYPNHFYMPFERYDIPAINNAEFNKEGTEILEGESSWPERFSMDFWHEELAKSGALDFQLQQMASSEPLYVDERSLIDVEAIETVEAEAKNLVCFVDPSGGTDEFAAAFACMVKDDKGKRIYIRDVIGLQKGDVETSDDMPFEVAAFLKIVERCKELGCRRLMIESNFHVMGGFARIVKMHKCPVMLQEFHTSGNKEKKLKKLLHYQLNMRSMVMHPSIKDDPKTVSQMKGLKSTKGLPPLDDRLDVLYMAADFFKDQIKMGTNNRGGSGTAIDLY
jgi:hypothetical protein